MKKVILIHGWEGNPENCWFPWLKRELEARGFLVSVPAMPDTEEPRIKKWVPALAEAVGNPDGETYFVGHSIGCPTILRYLESLPEGIKVGGAVFVAGFISTLTGLEDDDTVRDVAKEWLMTPLDLEKVKTHLPKSVLILSDDDEFVSVEASTKDFGVLGSKVVVEHGKGHFDDSRGVMELPSVLEAVEDLFL